MPPIDYPLVLWRGNSEWIPLGFEQEDESDFDLTGSKLIFRATSDGGDAIRKSSAVPDSGLEITDAEAGEFELSFTIEETRGMAASYKYEIERWIGNSQKSLIFGTIIVTTWVNDDVDP